MAAYSEHAPSPALADWVECGWRLETEAAVSDYSVPPDGCLDLIYDRVAGLLAVGSMTTAQSFELAPGAQMAGVRFRPGMARSFLGECAAELTNRAARFEDLNPRQACELRRRLDDAESIQDAMRLMLGSLFAPTAPANAVQRAIGTMEALHGAVDLEWTARQANLSVRQFRRRCLEESGLSPKMLCRVLRFRHACRCAGAAGRPDWSDIAADAGYFDQAHLIRDFRAFAGVTPMAAISNTRV